MCDEKLALHNCPKERNPCSRMGSRATNQIQISQKQNEQIGIFLQKVICKL